MTMIPDNPTSTYGLRDCPDCDGNGQIDTLTGEPAINRFVSSFYIDDCPTCDGTGKVRI